MGVKPKTQRQKKNTHKDSKNINCKTKYTKQEIYKQIAKQSTQTKNITKAAKAKQKQ